MEIVVVNKGGLCETNFDPKEKVDQTVTKYY